MSRVAHADRGDGRVDRDAVAACHAERSQDARVRGIRHRRGRPARGMVLVVALLVLVVLGLASIALVRAVDTATLVTGHLASKQAAMAAVDRGIEHAIAALWAADAAITDRTHDDLAQNYYACVQGNAGGCVAAGSEIPELPSVLASTQALAAAGLDPALVAEDGAGQRSVYVIERLCLAPGPAEASRCNLPPAGGNNQDLGATTGATATPDAYYRVTVKVSGARDALAYAQAILQPPRGASRERRIAWRIVTAE